MLSESTSMFATFATFIASMTAGTILPAVILVVVGILAIKAVMKIVDKSLERSKLERAATGLIKSVLKVLLYLLLGLMVASKLGIDVTGIVALTSVASLAVSLSLQDTLANVIGGFTLLSNHPFKSGDFVEIAGQSGVVQSIELNYTKLSTGDNKIISIPNSAVVAAQIVNYSTSTTRRVDFTVTASYNAPLEKVKEALLNAAAIPAVLSDPAPFAGVNKYGDSAIEYVLRVWTKTDDYWDAYFTINENIKAAFDANGIEMTYPHLNVHLDK